MRDRIPYRRFRDRLTLPRPLPILAAALALALGSLPTQADEQAAVPRDWGISMFGIENCFGTLQYVQNDFTPATDCAIEQVFSSLADSALQFVERHGKAQFGEHFHIDRRLGLTASTGTLSADLDVILPLSALSSTEGDTVTRAFFVQNGVTRWRDARGFQRSDVRLGAVHRHALFEEPGDGVIGASMFVQENLERGHARLVTGLEYLDRWGQGSLTYYMPTTDWRPGHHGYEERAIAGAELAYSADLTTTVHLRAAAGRWESQDGSGAWADRARLGLGWQPHPWFELQGGWDDVGAGDDSVALHASVSIPLGVLDRLDLRWEGLGRRDPESRGSDVGAIWQSVDHVGQIEVIEREAHPGEDDDERIASAIHIPDLTDRLPANGK